MIKSSVCSRHNLNDLTFSSRHLATMDSDEEDSAEEDDDLPDAAENDQVGEVAVGPSGSDAQTHGAGFKTRVLEGLLRYSNST